LSIFRYFNFTSKDIIQISFIDSINFVKTPPSVWLGGFFSPQAFLTAVMQTAARRAELPLDRMTLSVEVTKKTREEISCVGFFIPKVFVMLALKLTSSFL
jgi:hypothetical protein